jgi:hypothetical protein
MKQSEIFRENAENCAHLAESAANEPTFLRYKRMEAAWLALANEQDWLDGEVSPAPLPLPATAIRATPARQHPIPPSEAGRTRRNSKNATPPA